MAVARGKLFLLASAAAASLLVFGSSVATASTPLITSGLVSYYDFDNFTDTVMDGSGNGFHGKVQDTTRSTLDQPFTLNTTGVISNDHVKSVRGGGSINFLQSTVAGEDPVFVDLDGSVITANAAPGSLPKDTNAISLSAWVYATDYSGDFTIFNGASGGHGVPHFQIQGDGKIRFTIRDAAGNNVVNSNNPYINQPAVDGGAAGIPFPLNEWHNVTITYDYNGTPGATLDMYYDGVKIRTQGNTGPGTNIGPWALRAPSDYYDGLAFGSVYDSGGRRTRGNLDEAYIFNRKLTDAEVALLVSLGNTPGDYNGDGKVNASDYVIWRDNPAANGGNPAGYNTWRSNFGAGGGGAGVGSASAVPEPASLALVLLSLSFFSGLRRR